MQVRRHQMDYVLYFTVIILCAIGVLTVFSASTIIALHSDQPAAYFARKQLYWALFGVLLLTVISQVPYRFWYKFCVPLMLINIALLLAVLVPGVGAVVNGGRRWIGHGAMHLQPSELAIIASVVYLAFFFTKQSAHVQNFKRGLMPGVVVAGLNFVLIFAEPDMGTAMTLFATAMVVIFASGARLKPLLILMGGLAPILIGLALTASYRSSRITAWLHPLSHADAKAYQLVQGMTAISAGGWFGRGFDMSIEKMGYLPYPQTDFIFPVFVEEWGLIGAIALLITFAVVVWRGFYIARRSPDRFAALLAVGLTSMFTLKSFINLGAVTGLLPVTGIPLPFISYGGTSLVVNLIAIGMLLSISRYTLESEPEEDQLAEVIEVGEVAELRDRRAAWGGEQPSHRASGTGNRAGNVQPLRPRQTSQRQSGANWRTRQEVAVTNRTSTKRTYQKDASSTAQVGTWRERNASQPGVRGQANKSKKRGLFRKDR